MSRETHYDVLGAPRTSTAAELKQAYRRALRTSHPDVGGSAESFRLVQAAWAVLSDAARRAEYDRLHMPQASPPPQAGTRRERTSSRRAAGQPTTPPPPRADATPTFATAHGHPGGSSRARYLDVAREWMLSPQPPEPPEKPPRIRHEQDRFLHMWGVVFLQLTVTFSAIVLGLTVLAAVRGDLPSLPADILWPTLRALASGVAGVAFLCGGGVAMLRLATSPARAEVRRGRAENRNLYAQARRQFADDLTRRPSDPRAFLRSPYTAESVSMTPALAREHLARAGAQETIAKALKTLNAEFTVWHDVCLGDAGVYASHLVVGPQGLFLVEPIDSRGHVNAARVGELATAIGVTGLSGVLFVDLDPAAVNAPPAKLSDVPTLVWRVGTSRLASTLGGGIHGLERGQSWEVRQLVERVARRVAFA